LAGGLISPCQLWYYVNNQQEPKVEKEAEDKTFEEQVYTCSAPSMKFRYADGKRGQFVAGVIKCETPEEAVRMEEAIAGMSASSRSRISKIDMERAKEVISKNEELRIAQQRAVNGTATSVDVPDGGKRAQELSNDLTAGNLISDEDKLLLAQREAMNTDPEKDDMQNTVTVNLPPKVPVVNDEAAKARAAANIQTGLGQVITPAEKK
jgi:hypothetical protein